MEAAELTEYLTEQLGADAIVDSVDEYGTHTLTLTREAYVDAVQLLRDDQHLAFDMFDSSFGIDEREAGFSVVNVLYSTTKRHRVLVKVFADGGRENPVVPSVAHVYEGANWMERETWDMYGIEFEGHPGLAPRILTVENFEGWPLRKDFHLASRAAKPWPGVKEPAETDEDGNVLVKEPRIGDAPGPMPLDELMAEQARRANALDVEDDEAEAAEADGGEQPAVESGREEVEIDQETYDALIAEGKSERIARSKAKAAFVKKSRGGSGGGPVVEGSTAPPEEQGTGSDQSTPAEPDGGEG